MHEHRLEIVLACGMGALFAGVLLRVRARRRMLREEEASGEPVTPDATQVRTFSKRQQLWRALLSDGELLLENGMKVRHLMTSDPLTVTPKATTAEIRRLMSATRVHHLLVCEEGRLRGVISDRDLCQCDDATAEHIMRRQIHSVTPATSLGSAIHTLIEKNISCLPVLEGERLCGILSTTDLVLTLQCSLQLWLRMAQAFRRGGQWANELEKFRRTVQREVAAEQEQLLALRELLASSGPDQAIAERAAALVDAGSRLAAELEAAEQRMQENADQWISLSDPRMDRTTGLASRRELEAVLKLLLAMRNRYSQDFSTVLVAVDASGDSELSERTQTRLMTAIRLIAETIRSSDFAARLEEQVFGVVLPQTKTEEAVAFCERLRASAAALEQEATLTFSMAIVVADDAATPALILDHGRLLLTEAEAGGGNCVRMSAADLCAPEMDLVGRS
jgi:GGDEF domain-containing protein/predicted transcriptional regulator